MYEIYEKYALKPEFRKTLYSALILIFAPGFTNLYYTFRPNGLFAPFMPFIMPIACVAQYFYVFNKDLESFCFNEEHIQESKALREKYEIIYKYSPLGSKVDGLIDDFRVF